MSSTAKLGQDHRPPQLGVCSQGGDTGRKSSLQWRQFVHVYGTFACREPYLRITHMSQVVVILALRGRSREDMWEFEASLVYTVSFLGQPGLCRDTPLQTNKMRCKETKLPTESLCNSVNGRWHKPYQRACVLVTVLSP